MDERDSIPGRGMDSFSSSPHLDRFWGSTTLLSIRIPGVKQLGLESDHSPASSADVHKALKYKSTLQYVFIAWCLIKQCIRLQGVVFC